jgi:BirA family biotin operon repressor/biotin-[acetyl-CoA-carboxylase] ligase
MPQALKGLGEPLIALPEVDSTNNYAMARIAEGPVEEGTAWLAMSQTAGRGQRGRPWRSEPGASVLISVVLKPSGLVPSEQFMLSAAVALGFSDLVKRFAGDAVKIKWSNDVYIGDKKAGGVLIENVIRGTDWTHAVVGIGLNVNQQTFPPELPNPVSLRQATGGEYDVREVARELCRCLTRRYHMLRPAAFRQILQEYTGELYGLHTRRVFRRGEETFSACIEGVQKDGRLILRTADELLSFGFGEITFMI